MNSAPEGCRPRHSAPLLHRRGTEEEAPKMEQGSHAPVNRSIGSTVRALHTLRTPTVRDDGTDRDGADPHARSRPGSWDREVIPEAPPSARSGPRRWRRSARETRQHPAGRGAPEPSHDTRLKADPARVSSTRNHSWVVREGPHPALRATLSQRERVRFYLSGTSDSCMSESAYWISKPPDSALRRDNFRSYKRRTTNRCTHPS